MKLENVVKFFKHILKQLTVLSGFIIIPQMFYSFYIFINEKYINDDYMQNFDGYQQMAFTLLLLIYCFFLWTVYLIIDVVLIHRKIDKKLKIVSGSMIFAAVYLLFWFVGNFFFGVDINLF